MLWYCQYRVLLHNERFGISTYIMSKGACNVIRFKYSANMKPKETHKLSFFITHSACLIHF